MSVGIYYIYDMKMYKYFIEVISYRQFFIENFDSKSDFSEHDWTDEDSEKMLSIGNYSLAIGTYREGEIPLEILILERSDQINENGYDRVTRCQIEFPSMEIIIMSVFSDETMSPRIKLDNKGFDVEIYYFGKNTISPDGFSGDDYYKVYLRPREVCEETYR